MRALIFDGEHVRLDIAHPEPRAEPGDAIIRLIRAAVSATDLEICKGLFGFSGIIGHQFVGVVESVKSAAPDLIGKRVVGSIATLCGNCDMCTSGLSRHCRHRTILGMKGRDGCLAERFALPAKNLSIVPERMDNDHAVFATLVAAAVQAAEQLTIVGKPYITVLGDGPLGLLTVQVMARLNASVRLIGKHLEKLAICEKWGIKHRHIDEVGRRADQDIVVDCTGSSSGLELAMQLVRPRGKILSKSLAAAAAGRECNLVDWTRVVCGEIEVIGSFVGPTSEGLRLLERREVDVSSLISRRMSLSDGLMALRAASQKDVVLVVVDP